MRGFATLKLLTRRKIIDNTDSDSYNVKLIKGQMHKNLSAYIYSLIVSAIIAIIICGCACTPKPPQQLVPNINSFSADKTNIYPGQSITLEWNTSGANTIDIQPAIGKIGPSGSLTLSPNQTCDYVLTATNEAGSITASVLVTVMPEAITKPDLVITDIFGYDGKTLLYKIKNQGDAEAKPSKTHLYVVGYMTYARPRAVDHVDPLAPGEEITTTFPNLDFTYDQQGFRLQATSNEYLEEKTFTICADVDNEVDESNEDNNCLAGSGL
jgi:hypothetical protein